MQDLSPRAVPVVAALPTATTALAGVTLRLAANNKPYWCDGIQWTSLGATGGAGGSAFYEADITIGADYTITTGKNAMTPGPITISSGVTVTVPSGSVWSII